MSFSEEIPTERILNFVALGDQELGTSEMQGPRKWKSIKTFQTLPKNGVGVGKKHDFFCKLVTMVCSKTYINRVSC